jgi:hypothetical protein
MDIDQNQKKIIYAALRQHDGPSLRPDLPPDEQEQLSIALDELRAKFFEELTRPM